MKPKILLLDKPHPKAMEIMESVAYVEESDKYADNIFTMSPLNDYNIVYTQLTPIKINVPVFCPCTRIDHIQAPKIIYLDEHWKAMEGQNITSTAEHTWSLILQLAKINRMQLRGKTLGIIGYGRLGRQVSRYADPFIKNILPFDVIDFKDIFEGSSGCWHLKNIPLKDVFKCSDIITLHVPLTKETHGMIGRKEFDMMKPGVLLVNTSRSEIVEKIALINALYSKTIGGYADDFLNEFEITGYDNVIQTPSIGGNCLEAREATDIYIAKQVVNMFEEEQQ